MRKIKNNNKKESGEKVDEEEIIKTLARILVRVF